MLFLFINAAIEFERPNDLPAITHEISGRAGVEK